MAGACELLKHKIRINSYTHKNKKFNTTGSTNTASLFNHKHSSKHVAAHTIDNDTHSNRPQTSVFQSAWYSRFASSCKILFTFFLTPSFWLASFSSTGVRNFPSVVSSCSSESADPSRKNTRSNNTENGNTEENISIL